MLDLANATFDTGLIAGIKMFLQSWIKPETLPYIIPLALLALSAVIISIRKKT